MQAEEFQRIGSSLIFWQAYEPAVKCDLSSCARRLGNRLYFIDPIPLAGPALDELIAVAAPAAVLLTNGNHARAAAWFRDRFSIPICAHPAVAPGLGLAIDQPISDGDLLFDEFTAITLPGGAAGELTFYAQGAVHVGDALIHLEPLGFDLLPKKYCTDAPELRRSLGKLLRFDFEVLTFAHGLPLISRARHRLAELLA